MFFPKKMPSSFFFNFLIFNQLVGFTLRFLVNPRLRVGSCIDWARSGTWLQYMHFGNCKKSTKRTVDWSFGTPKQLCKQKMSMFLGKMLCVGYLYIWEAPKMPLVSRCSIFSESFPESRGQFHMFDVSNQKLHVFIWSICYEQFWFNKSRSVEKKRHDRYQIHFFPVPSCNLPSPASKLLADQRGATTAQRHGVRRRSGGAAAWCHASASHL